MSSIYLPYYCYLLIYKMLTCAYHTEVTLRAILPIPYYFIPLFHCHLLEIITTIFKLVDSYVLVLKAVGMNFRDGRNPKMMFSLNNTYAKRELIFNLLDRFSNSHVYRNLQISFHHLITQNIFSRCCRELWVTTFIYKKRAT